MAAAQSSRGSLIATTVVSLVLALTFFILSIVFYVKKTQAEQDLKNTSDQYTDVVLTTGLASSPITDFQTIRASDKNAFNTSQSLASVAFTQIQRLASKLAGVENSVEALGRADTALASATKIEGVRGTSVTGALQSAIDALNASTQRVKTLEADVAAAQSETASEIQKANQVKLSTDEQVKAADQRTNDMNAAMKGDRDKQNQLIADLQRELQEMQTRMGDLREQSDRDLTAQRGQIAQKQAEYQALVGRLADLRQPTDVNISAEDGTVVRSSPTGERVFVSLGRGDAVSPGMTFEVFDSAGGTPGPRDLDNPNETAVRGKASIELIRVEEGSSEARVIRKDPGANVVQGDLLVNLVYDRNTTYNFVVFGEFDLDRNRIPSASDTEVIKRLVGEWGGKVVDDVNVATDFVILGVEPQVPQFTSEDLQDPGNVFLQEQAKNRLAEFDNIRNQAERLSIPVLNQNRFLYLVGYYNLAAR